MSNKACYLAGPINGLSFRGATDWRVKAEKEMAAVGIRGYSPMRGKEYLQEVYDGNIKYHPDGSGHILHQPRSIMTRDYNDCTTADALLVNYLGFDGVSLGTAMEQAWAYHLHIPVVVVARRDYAPLKHPMLSEATDFWVESLDEGLAVIKTILLPGGRP